MIDPYEAAVQRAGIEAELRRRMVGNAPAVMGSAAMYGAMHSSNEPRVDVLPEGENIGHTMTEPTSEA